MATLVDLANDILRHATGLQNRLDKIGAPQPSFEIDGPQAYPNMDSQVVQMRASLIEASRIMNDLARGPVDTLRHLISNQKAAIAVVRTISHFKIAETVPEDGKIALSELANRIAVNEKALKRILQHAFLIDMFKESEPGYIVHTPLSIAVLRLKDLVELTVDDIFFHSFARLPEALEVWSDPPKPGVRQNPIHIALNTNQDFFKLLDSRPGGMKSFDAALQSVDQLYKDPLHQGIAEFFDWASLTEGPVIDVAGGSGFMVVDLARRFPSLKFVVQDLEHSKAHAKELIFPEFEGRGAFQVQDFFTPQPADLVPKVYFMRWIFHDWPDQDCVRILKTLIPAMEQGCVLIVVEHVLPEHDEIPKHFKSDLYHADLCMFTLGGKERNLKDWKDMFNSADSRLAVHRSTYIPATPFSVMEVRIGT